MAVLIIKIISILFCLILICDCQEAINKYAIESDVESLIPPNYSIHQPPINPNGGPIRVNFSIILMNVREIDELGGSLALEMNIRIFWRDDRLSNISKLIQSDNPYLVINPIFISKIWKPDAYFDHTKEILKPALISSPASLRMFSNNTLRYSERMTLRVACQMDFHYYPMDIQRCDIDLQSFAYSNKFLTFNWHQNKSAYLKENLQLQNFYLIIDSTTEHTRITSSKSTYSILRFTMLLKRKLAYHMIQTYVPSGILIVISWLSFLVPPEQIGGRLAFSITILLTLSTMFGSIRQSTPSVSYLKALDIWMISCIFFVFLVLLEYTIVLNFTEKAAAKEKLKKEKLEKEKEKENLKKDAFKRAEFKRSESLSEKHYYDPIRRMNIIPRVSCHGFDNEKQTNLPSPPPEKTGQVSKYKSLALKVEFYSTMILPSLFFTFNFIYWPWLINAADYQDAFN